VQTSFRRWHSNEEDNSIPGLKPALKKAGLSSYEAALGVWCESAGAVDLEELAEEDIIQSICKDLQLPQLEGMRLRGMLARSRSPSLSQASTCSPMSAPAGHVAEAMYREEQVIVESIGGTDRSEQQHHLMLSAKQTCPQEFCDGAEKSREAQKAQSHSPLVRTKVVSPSRTSLPRQRSLGLADQQSVLGLHGALVEADLTLLAHRVEAWCAEFGIRVIEEILEELEDLSEALSLDLDQQVQLQTSLKLRASGPCKGVGASMLHRSSTESFFGQAATAVPVQRW